MNHGHDLFETHSGYPESKGEFGWIHSLHLPTSQNDIRFRSIFVFHSLMACLERKSWVMAVPEESEWVARLNAHENFHCQYVHRPQICWLINMDSG